MQEQVSLRQYNSFGFDVKAKHFAEITCADELVQLIESGILKTEKHLIISGGNNILFCDDYFDGLVIHVNIKGFSAIGSGPYVTVTVAAGEDWPDFVKRTVEMGLYGLENLAHIPGKVGAAPVQNIGAYGAELKDHFVCCEAIELTTGKRRTFSREECEFGYRSSIFKTHLKGKYLITNVTFLLSKEGTLNLEYSGIKKHLEQNGITKPALSDLHDAICTIRDAKLPDVKKIGNAGSFFKNPIIGKEQFDALLEIYPDMPHYAEPDGNVKIPAGWLIEKAGWKGWRDEHVGVYEKQALVLVHYGGGKGCDILALATRIFLSVEDKFGIEIAPEVNFV